MFSYISQNTIAQNYAKIDVALQQEMILRDSTELIRINIILNQQYDQAEMRSKSSVYRTKEQKRSFVIDELKSFSKEEQQGLMNLLSTMPDVSDVQTFWIANLINCYANIEAIEEITLHPDVLLIGFDKDENVLPEKNLIHAAPTRGITYNILKVQADKVWASGYEGDGVIVAVLDTGINYDHDDLKNNMWSHPDFPYHGYNFVDNNNDPMDDNGHGTHVAGTVAGDGASGSQTGIAPKAKIMALKVLDWAPVSVWVSGIEFAIEYGAHILNLSLGYINWINDGIYETYSLILRNAMVNVLEVGVIAAVAAGNEGDLIEFMRPPKNVRTPGNCPPPWLHPDQITTGGLSAVVCVGVTDIDDNIWYSIGGASSIGPVTWQDIEEYEDYPYKPGMGLIRPDVCAPGEDIKSLDCWDNSGYVTYYGGWTSMATPCVAGVMALMLSANQELTPAQICEILETTAVRLPDISSPKNNTFGSGRVDAYAAVLTILCMRDLPTEEVIISQNTAWSESKCAIGTYIVNNGATLTITSEIKCSPNTKFIVEPGGSLIYLNR